VLDAHAYWVEYCCEAQGACSFLLVQALMFARGQVCDGGRLGRTVTLPGALMARVLSRREEEC
jgi:hypothetical protein